MHERGSRFGSPRTALPLALALGLHLLLVLALLGRAPPAPDDGSRLVSVLIPVLAPRPRAQPAPPIARPPAAAAATPVAPASTPSVVAPASPAPEPSPDTAPADPFAGAVSSPPSAYADSELAGRAKRAAGPIDRALRGGQSGVPENPDTPWLRFQRTLAAAHIDRSNTVNNDRYTAADGVTIYRSRQGDRVTCRIGGSVGIATGGFGGATAAGAVPCPRGVTWERY